MSKITVKYNFAHLAGFSIRTTIKEIDGTSSTDVVAVSTFPGPVPTAEHGSWTLVPARLTIAAAIAMISGIKALVKWRSSFKNDGLLDMTLSRVPLRLARSEELAGDEPAAPTPTPSPAPAATPSSPTT